MYKYKYFSTHLQVFKQKVNLNNTSLYTLSIKLLTLVWPAHFDKGEFNIGSVLA